MKSTVGFQELMCKFQGIIFGNGEYRLHNLKDIAKWNDIISDAFPEVKGKIECFGSDWLGRQLAIFFLIFTLLEGDGYMLFLNLN